MRGLLTHYRIRLIAVLTDPYSLVVFLLTGLMSLMYWPGLIRPGQVLESIVTSGEGLNDGFLMIIWIFVWPMLAGSLAGGSVAASGREAMAQRPMPTLPPGMKTRVAAEVLLVLTFAFIARVPVFLFGESVYQGFYLPGMLDAEQLSMSAFVQRTFLGAAIMAPATVLWVAPARSAHAYFMIRPGILVGLVLAAMLLGLMASPLPCLLTCLALTVLFLATLDLEIRLPALTKKRRQPIETRWRPALHPEARARRDFWLKPLPAAMGLLLLECLLVVVNQIVTLPEYGFYFGSCLVFGFMFSLVGLRPMGMYFIETAISGRTGSPRSGNPGRVWMTLPVRFEAMTRGIYLHGLIAGSLLWCSVITVAGFTTFIESGTFALQHTDGDSSAGFLVPFLALIPCLAGGSTSMAVGDMVRGFLSIGAAVGIILGHVGMLIAKVPTPAHVTVLIAFALVGGVPALVHLRAPRDDDMGGGETSGSNGAMQREGAAS